MLVITNRFQGNLHIAKNTHILLFKFVKIKIMKATAIIFGLIISLNCLSQSYKKENNQNLDISFTKFTSKFVILKFPLEISRLNDLGKYSDKIVKEVKGKTVLAPNPLCPIIPTNKYKYIKDKYPTNKKLLLPKRV